MNIRKLIMVFVIGITFSLVACDVASTTTTTDTNSNTTTTAPQTTTTTTTTQTTTSTTTTALRVFTLAELATFNGNNGSTAYMAVNGTVYNVTNVAEWSNGWHKGMHLAGTDASAVFAGSPHSLGFLSQLTIVGTLQ